MINPQNQEPVISTPPVHTQACTSGSTQLPSHTGLKKAHGAKVFSGKAAIVVLMVSAGFIKANLSFLRPLDKVKKF